MRLGRGIALSGGNFIANNWSLSRLPTDIANSRDHKEMFYNHDILRKLGSTVKAE